MLRRNGFHRASGRTRTRDDEDDDSQHDRRNDQQCAVGWSPDTRIVCVRRPHGRTWRASLSLLPAECAHHGLSLPDVVRRLAHPIRVNSRGSSQNSVFHHDGSGRNGPPALADGVGVEPVHEACGRLVVPPFVGPVLRRGRRRRGGSNSGPPKAQDVVSTAGTVSSSRRVPSGRVSLHSSASEDRHPQVALGIDGEAVGRADLGVDGDQCPAVRDRPGLAVEGERVDASRATVDEVHRLAVGTPSETVGDRQTGEDELDVTGAVESVQVAASDVEVVRPKCRPTADLADRTPRRSCACRPERRRLRPTQPHRRGRGARSHDLQRAASRRRPRSG